MRQLAAALAVLLAVAPVAAVPTAAPSAAADPPAATVSPVVADENTTEYLAIPDEAMAVQRVESVTLDVGATMAADNAAIYGRFGAVRLVEAYRDADSPAERRAVLRESAARLEQRVSALRARERRAREEFNAGTLTATEFLRTLVRIDARARKLQQAIVRLNDYNDATRNTPISMERIATLRGRSVILDGPVRSTVKSALSGETSPVQIYIASGNESLALAAIVPGSERYQREAYVLSNRQPTGPNRFNGSYTDALDRLKEIYPWTWNHAVGSSFRTKFGLNRVGVYPFRIDNTHGSLVTYLDGTTRTSFYEVQRKDLSAVPTEAPVTATDESLFVQVNRTRAGGPLDVRVRNAVTLEPVDARISVKGTVIGRTGDDGRLWTVTPARRVVVTATRGSANVSVTTAPAP